MSGFTTGAVDNPALTDNWDDAEGYYSMYPYLFNFCCCSFNTFPFFSPNKMLKLCLR